MGKTSIYLTDHLAAAVRASKTPMPVLLKRGMAATIQELLLAAEYVLAAGNPHVILCERGVRVGASPPTSRARCTGSRRGDAR